MEETKATKGIAKYDESEALDQNAINQKLNVIKEKLPDVNRNDPEMDAQLRMMIQWHINPLKLLAGTNVTFTARDLDFMKMTTLLTGTVDFAKRNILGAEYHVEDMIRLLFDYELKRRVPDLDKIEELIAQNKDLNERFELQTEFLKSKLNYERKLSELKEKHRIETANMERDIAAREKREFEEKSAALEEKISILEKNASEAVEKIASLETEKAELRKQLDDADEKYARLKEEKEQLESRMSEYSVTGTEDPEESPATDPVFDPDELKEIMSGIMNEHERKMTENVSARVVGKIETILAQKFKTVGKKAPDYSEDLDFIKDKTLEILSLVGQEERQEKKGFLRRLFGSETAPEPEPIHIPEKHEVPENIDYDDVVEGLVREGTSENALALILYCMNENLPDKYIRKLADPELEDTNRLQLAKYYFVRLKKDFTFQAENRKEKAAENAEVNEPDANSEVKEEVYVVSEEEDE